MVVDDLLVVRDPGQEVEELVVGHVVGSDELLGELVDAPDDEEEAERDEVEDCSDPDQDDDCQPGEEGHREVECSRVCLSQGCTFT